MLETTEPVASEPAQTPTPPPGSADSVAAPAVVADSASDAPFTLVNASEDSIRIRVRRDTTAAVPRDSCRSKSGDRERTPDDGAAEPPLKKKRGRPRGTSDRGLGLGNSPADLKHSASLLGLGLGMGMELEIPADAGEQPANGGRVISEDLDDLRGLRSFFFFFFPRALLCCLFSRLFQPFFTRNSNYFHSHIQTRLLPRMLPTCLPRVLTPLLHFFAPAFAARLRGMWEFGALLDFLRRFDKHLGNGPLYAAVTARQGSSYCPQFLGWPFLLEVAFFRLRFRPN